MAKPKYVFDQSLMGKLVIITQVLERRYESNKRFWQPVNLDEKRAGWIVGTSFVCNGIYSPGDSGYNDWDDYQSPSLTVTEKIPCLLVTYWPSQKPVKIPVDGFLIWDEVRWGNSEYSKIRPYCSSGYGSGKNRRDFIQQYKNWLASDNCKRDSKGRFVK
jgi:hypothetical protein